MKTTIWYEFADKNDVQTLRDAADALEKKGYVKLWLPNVELDDPPIVGGAVSSNNGFATGGSAGSSPGVALYGTLIGTTFYGPGGSGSAPQGVSASGCNGFSSGTAYGLERAKATGRPVCYAGGGGGGMPGYGDWIFPDGHSERLPAGEAPKWPKDNPTRDAVRANQ